MSYEYMTGLGAIRQQAGMQQRPGMTQQRPGMMQQQPRQWTQEMKDRLRASGCGGQPCPEDKPVRNFFSVMYKRSNPDAAQRMAERGCSEQCVEQGVNFFCCPAPQEQMPEGAPVDDPMFDPEMMDPEMDPFMMDQEMMPVDMTETVTVVEEEKKPPWLLIGVGVLGLGVIGYLLATRK